MKQKKQVPDNHYICERCDGIGVLFERDRESDFNMKVMYKCPKCKGEGYVDWARHPMNYEEIYGTLISIDA